MTPRGYLELAANEAIAVLGAGYRVTFEHTTHLTANAQAHFLTVAIYIDTPGDLTALAHLTDCQGDDPVASAARVLESVREWLAVGASLATEAA